MEVFVFDRVGFNAQTVTNLFCEKKEYDYFSDRMTMLHHKLVCQRRGRQTYIFLIKDIVTT